MTRTLSGKPDFENSSCRRTLCPDGTVCESITLWTSSDGHEVTDEELAAWIATFPIEAPDGPHTLEAITAAGNIFWERARTYANASATFGVQN